MISTLAARIRRLHPRRHEPSIEEIEEHSMLWPDRGAVIIVAALIAVTGLVGLAVRLLLS